MASANSLKSSASSLMSMLASPAGEDVTVNSKSKSRVVAAASLLTSSSWTVTVAEPADTVHSVCEALSTQATELPIKFNAVLAVNEEPSSLIVEYPAEELTCIHSDAPSQSPMDGSQTKYLLSSSS